MIRIPALIVLLLSVVGCTLAASHVSFSGNVSANPQANNWQYRRIAIASSSTTGFSFTSSSVTGNSDGNDNGNGKGKAKGRVTKTVFVVGGASVTDDNLIASYIASYNKDANVNASQFAYSSDITKSLGFVTSALYKLQEIDASSNTVNEVAISSLNWVFSEVSKDSTDSLFAVAATGTSNSSSLKITITFLTAKHIGKTNMANAVVTPKSIESIIEVSGYSLSSASNRLVLLFIVASGRSNVTEGNGLVSGTSFSSGNYASGSQVFFSLSHTCYANGDSTTSPVKISNQVVDVDDASMSNLTFLASVRAKYAGELSLRIFRAVFPVGANSIVYDPTTGSGQVVTEVDTDTTTSAAVRMLNLSMSALVLVLMSFYIML